MSAPAGPGAGTALALALDRRRRVLCCCFWVYAAALFTATHWPALELHVPMVERPDLIIHFGCFGTWFALFWLAGFAGPPLRFGSIGLSIAAALLYAAFDEGMQALPFVRRHCAWDDYFANCGGILLASGLAVALALWSVRRPRT